MKRVFVTLAIIVSLFTPIHSQQFPYPLANEFVTTCDAAGPGTFWEYWGESWLESNGNGGLMLISQMRCMAHDGWPGMWIWALLHPEVEFMTPPIEIGYSLVVNDPHYGN